MSWILVAIIGWCGTRWPVHFGGGSGGSGGSGGGVEPGDWPTNCPMCGQLAGAISAVILVVVIGPLYTEAGFLGMVAISFFGGNFGGTLIGLTRGRSTRVLC